MYDNSSIPRFEFYDRGQRIINEVNILEVFQKYCPSVDLSKAYSGNVKCPRESHQDKKPSTKIYHETNSCYCFGCQQGWNSLTLYAEMTNQSLEGSSFVQTMKNFAEDFGIDWRKSEYSNYEERENIKWHLYHQSSEPQFYDRLALTSIEMNFIGLYDDRANGLILSEEWEKNKTDVEEGLFKLIENKFQEVSSTLADTLDIIVAYERNFNVKTEKSIKEEYNSGMKSLLENPNYWINTTQLHERVENKVKNDVAEKFNIKPEEVKQRINNYDNYINQFSVAKQAGSDVLKSFYIAQRLVNHCMERKSYCEAVHKPYEGMDIDNIEELSAETLYNSQAKHYQRFNFAEIFDFKGLDFEKVIQDCKEKETQEKEENTFSEPEEKEEKKWDKDLC